ncbi:MAG: hypothetical protein WA057_06730, partial [Candidatus Magasanikiibacteriota bacterium]
MQKLYKIISILFVAFVLLVSKDVVQADTIITEDSYISIDENSLTKDYINNQESYLINFHHSYFDHFLVGFDNDKLGTS